MAWKLASNSHLNSVVAAENGLTITESIKDGEPNEAVGSYHGCLKLAAHLKWDYETTNGYKMIFTRRYYDGTRFNRKIVKIEYVVFAHFGMPEYVACTLTRLEEVKS